MDQRNEYHLDAIAHWLAEFLTRFFATSQFKRSALPDGPKVGSGGSVRMDKYSMPTQGRAGRTA